MNNSFVRKERKYIIGDEIVQKMTGMITKHLDLSEYNQENTLIDIKNIYLESDTFCVYSLRKNKKKNRFKIRFREYGKNGEYESSVWVELKEKRDGTGYKNRFKLDKTYIQDLLQGKDVLSRVLDQNRQVNPCYLKDLYETVQYLIEKNKLYPRMHVSYKRQAFQDGMAGKIRVTFDSNLVVGDLKRSQTLFNEPEDPHFFSEDNKIMEIKVLNKYPRWLKKKMDQYNIERVNFSKYMYAIEECFDTELNQKEACSVSDFEPIFLRQSI